MELYNIKIICLQETRRAKSDHIITAAGFLLILSGHNDDGADFAGVGFLIAPFLRPSIYGFCQHSNRIAYIEIRIPGGKWQ